MGVCLLLRVGVLLRLTDRFFRGERVRWYLFGLGSEEGESITHWVSLSLYLFAPFVFDRLAYSALARSDSFGKW